jgi:hypothetical protein
MTDLPGVRTLFAQAGPVAWPAGGNRPRGLYLGSMSLSSDAKVGVVVSILIAVLAASSSPWWWKHMPWAGSQSGPPAGVVGFSGGCDAFQVYVQNRWQPYGGVVRAEPNIDSNVESKLPGNFAVDVNGWVHSRAAYPTNTAPWNSDVWFHLADESGWVSFPGVRAAPVQQDPTGISPYGGIPVPTTAACEGSIQ